MRTLTYSVLLLLVIPVSAFAQKEARDDGPVGIFSSGAEYDQFMRGAKQLAYGDNGSPELKAMIPMLNDIALNRPMGWSNKKYGGQGGAFDLLSNSQVRQDLEMMDDQYEQLQQMNKDVQQRAGEQLRNLDFSDREKLISQIRKIREQAENDLSSVLLPHQLDRLKQLRNQSRLRNRSLVDVLTSDPVKTELDITDDQSDDLREAERQINEELEQEIAKLRERAREKLLSTLKREQREQVKEMFGDQLDLGDRQKTKPRKRGK